MQSLCKILVREVLQACQSIDGKYITLPADEKENGSFIIDTAMGAPIPERQLILKMTEVGWLFR